MPNTSHPSLVKNPGIGVSYPKNGFSGLVGAPGGSFPKPTPKGGGKK